MCILAEFLSTELMFWTSSIKYPVVHVNDVSKQLYSNTENDKYKYKSFAKNIVENWHGLLFHLVPLGHEWL